MGADDNIQSSYYWLGVKFELHQLCGFSGFCLKSHIPFARLDFPPQRGE